MHIFFLLFLLRSLPVPSIHACDILPMSFPTRSTSSLCPLVVFAPFTNCPRIHTSTHPHTYTPSYSKITSRPHLNNPRCGYQLFYFLPRRQHDHQQDTASDGNNLRESKYQLASTKEGSSQGELQARYLQVEPEWVYEGDYPNPLYLDDDQMGGHTRLSTIAEMSEMPSINITNSQDKVRPDSKTKRLGTGPVVISRDLVLEDLFVDGTNEREEEAHRQELLANLKPTDILGPIHETRGFHISSLTGQRASWTTEQQEKDQVESEFEDNDGGQDQEEQEQSRESTQRRYQDSIEEALENDMDESAIALKRSYERLFGPKGAVDSERSGSDVGLEAYDNSEDLYGAHEEDEEGEDDDDVYFGNDDDHDEVDEQEEEYYAMLDLNGGNTNMILGVSDHLLVTH